MEADISFIGLGQMGYPMALNIRKKLSKTSTLFIHDINASACTNFVTETKTNNYGPVEFVPTAKDAASKSKILISIVPASTHVRKVYLDKESGVLAAPKDADRLILESSTIDVDTTREVGEAVMAAGLGRYVDAPVSGGVRGAASGILAFMIGIPASDPLSPLITSIVSMMGAAQKISLCGALGNGLAAKICNNYLSGTFLVALSEAMAFGTRAGVDKKVLAEVIRNSSGQSWMGDNLNPVPGVLEHAPSSNAYQPGFRIAMILKDLGLSVDAARKEGVQPRMAETAVRVFEAAEKDARCEGKDFTSVYLHITDDQ